MNYGKIAKLHVGILTDDINDGIVSKISKLHMKLELRKALVMREQRHCEKNERE